MIKYKNKIAYTLFIVSLIAFVLEMIISGNSYAQNLKNSIAMHMIFISFIVLAIPTKKILNRDRKLDKKSIMNSVLENTFSEFKYFEKNGISSEELIKSDMVQANLSTCTDTIKSTIKDYSFDASNITLTQASGAGKNYNVLPLYSGLLIRVKKDLSLKGDIKFGEIKYFTAKTAYKKVKTTNNDFNKKFSVVVTNEEDLSLFTKEFTSAVLELERKYQGMFLFSYIDHIFTIGLNDRKTYFLEDESYSDDKLKKQIQSDLNIILDILNTLV